MTPPLETSSWHGDAKITRLSRVEAPSTDAAVIFHGFPGYPPKGEEAKYANVPRVRFETAKALVERAGFDAYLPVYEGLGESRGTFRFERSVTRSVEIARELCKSHRRLHVLGHSWGAFVAFNVHRALGGEARRLALLAGLLDLQSEERVRAWLPGYLESYPEIFGADASVDVEISRRFHRLAGGRYVESDADHLFSGADLPRVVDEVVAFFSAKA